MRVKGIDTGKVLSTRPGTQKALKVSILIPVGSGAGWQPWPSSPGSCSLTRQDGCLLRADVETEP